MSVKRIERGWVGHFIGGHRCRFRRNTLLECGEKKVVVSTVGAYESPTGRFETIGVDRWFETMAFNAKFEHGYWDADVNEIIDFESPWGLFAETWEELCKTYPQIDNSANDMHEAVVAELIQRLGGDTE